MTKKPITDPTTDRKTITHHPLAERIPPMSAAEYANLVADIREHGLNDAIVLYQGMILDGRHRDRACFDAGVVARYRDFRGSYEEATAFVLSANAHRRHLSVEQKRVAIEAIIKASPEKSDRQIAEEAKTNHKIVGRTRRRLESTGTVSQLAKRTGADGKARKQPTPDKPRHLGQPTAAQKAAEIKMARELFDSRPPANTAKLEQEVTKLREQKGALEIKLKGMESEIKDLEAARKPKLAASDPKGTLYCSFCDKSQHQVRNLITGPKNKVAICNECTDLCADIVRQQAQKQQAKAEPEIKPTAAAVDDGIPPFLDRTKPATEEQWKEGFSDLGRLGGRGKPH